MRILMLPSHVGLGHVARDLAIARWIRRINPRVVVEWCSAEPVAGYLSLWEEKVLECSHMLKSFSTAIEEIYNYNIYSVSRLAGYLGVLKQNYIIIREQVDFNAYDLVFADEFWEIMYAAPISVKKETVFGTDLVFKPYELNPTGNIISLVLNRFFKKSLLEFSDSIYLNALDETPDSRWFLLFGERVREWIKRNMYVAGLATSYLPGDLLDPKRAREELGLDWDARVITVTVGGTATRSKLLLEKVVRAYEILREKIQDLKLVVVAGPRTTLSGKQWMREDIVVQRVSKNLWNHYMASDLFITRAGRTTTADLECLPRPVKTLLVPIKGHFEQEHIAKTLVSKNKAFKYVKETISVGELAKLIEASLQETLPEANWRKGDCRGSIRAAEHLAKRLEAMT